MLLHIHPTGASEGNAPGSLAHASGWYMTFFAAGVIAVFDLGRRALDQGVFIGTVRRLQQTSSRSSQAQNSGHTCLK